MPIAMCFLMNWLYKWHVIFIWPFNSSPLEQNVTISITPLLHHVNLENICMLHYMWPDTNLWKWFYVPPFVCFLSLSLNIFQMHNADTCYFWAVCVIVNIVFCSTLEQHFNWKLNFLIKAYLLIENKKFTISITPLTQHVNLPKVCMLHYI